MLYLCKTFHFVKKIEVFYATIFIFHMKNNKLFIAIIISLLLGVLIGGIIHYSFPESIPSFANNIKLLGTVFIRLVQMIIAPLVFCTLVVGIAKMGDMKMVGRVGGKAMGWFITASLVSLTIGLVLVNWLKPGANANFDIQNVSGSEDLLAKTGALSLQTFIEHLIPKSVFESFAHNEILQIVVFAIFFGVALSSIGKKGKVVIKLFDRIAEVVLKMVNYIMWTAPLGVLGAIASAVALYGLTIFLTYAKYLVAFVIGLVVLWAVLILVGYLILGKDVWRLLKAIKEPLLIAFSTTSSEAVFPKLVENLTKYGCSPKIVSFTLPLGYSFNLDGSMMYMTFASIFIAQIYDVPLTLGDEILMLLVLMITSKGVAGVPRASLIVIVATCAMFNIPPEGIAFILPIDHFCDMGRSMTNVLGNALSTASIDKFESKGNTSEEVLS